jgi:hypothetical protein
MGQVDGWRTSVCDARVESPVVDDDSVCGVVATFLAFGVPCAARRRADRGRLRG